MMNNVTDAVTAGLLSDSVGSTTSWLPVDIPTGLLNITVSMSGGYGNVSVNYGSGMSGTETWESLSSTAAVMVYDRHLPKYPQATLVTLCVVLGCMIVATILGNVFVITAILVERSLQGVSNYLILSLAVTDLLVAVLVMPLSLLNEVSVHWYLGRALCDMWVSVDVLCCTASILHLVAIAMDRFWAVSKIDYVRRRCARQILLMIAVVWLVSVAISIPPLFGWRHESDNPELSGVCMISQDHGYTIFSTVGAFYCPLVLMLVLNFKIYRAARYRIRRKGFAHPSRKSRRTGHVALPVVQVEQETTARDALRNSSGSDVSQDGLSMFNPSCLINNEISRLDTGMDSNTGDYDQNYSYGGESSDSRQNDSYYPLATEDPDGPLPSPCFVMGPIVPAANMEADKSCLEIGANCTYIQQNSVGPLSNHSEVDTRSCLDSGANCAHTQLNSVGPLSPRIETEDKLCTCVNCVQYQLNSPDHLSPRIEKANNNPCVESGAHCAHQQLNLLEHTPPPVNTEADKSCMETCANCAHHQLNMLSSSPPPVNAEADRSCDVENCANHAHHDSNSIHPSSPAADGEEVDRSCMETDAANCEHDQLNPASPVSPSADTEMDMPCKESGACCVRHELNSAYRSMSSSHLAESQLCAETFFHHLSTSDVNHCVSCDIDPLNSQGSKHLAVAESVSLEDSFPIQITVEECDCPPSQCRLVQFDSTADLDRDKGVGDVSDGLRPTGDEALAGDDRACKMQRTNNVGISVTDCCSNNVMSVNCVTNNHNPQHHQLKGNHVAVESVDTQTHSCSQNHPGPNCLLVPNTHNSSATTTTTTTSLSGAQGNQLKVPHMTSVHTRQPSKSRANNNTKRARNREKEKQRREKLEMRRERKAARVLGIITGAFVVCWLPFFILALVFPFLPLGYHVPPVLASLFLWLGYFNSLLNPIIYTIFNPSFRKAFRKIFFKRLSSLSRS